MRLRHEANIGISTMLVLQILLSFLTITLLNRMGPAIEKIIEENARSGEAVEIMLGELAGAAEPTSEPTANFVKALQRARRNVTEEEEKPLLDTIEAGYQQAFAARGSARADCIKALRELGHVNRESMITADERAKRLSQAGAWGAALLGALALTLAYMVYRRLRLRIELPIEQLHSTTERIREGNLQARCGAIDGPIEVQRIGDDLNWLLDRTALAPAMREPKPVSQVESNLRRSLMWLLEQETRPAMIVDGEGAKISCNNAALTLKAEECPTGKAIAGTDWRLLIGETTEGSPSGS